MGHCRKSKMEEAILCKVCAEEFSDQDGHIPRILTACGHSFCETCLKKLQKKRSVSKDTYRRSWVHDGKYEKEVKTEVKYEIKCPKCKRETISDYSSASLPKNYSYLDLITEVVNSRSDEKFCEAHPKYILDMFCHEEEEAVCLNCKMYGKHKMHKVSKLSWFSDQQADSIRHKIDCLDEVINHYEILGSDLVSQKHNLELKVKCIQNAITSKFSQIQLQVNNILDAKQESVLSQLDKCSTSQSSLLAMQEEAASNFIQKLEEKRNYANKFLAESDESTIAKEKDLHNDLLGFLDEAQSHKLLINDLFEVQMDNSDHIVKCVKESVDVWVCSVQETNQEPLLESVSTLCEKKIPCYGDSINLMFGDVSEVVVNNLFEGIDCKFWCDGELQLKHSVPNFDGETDSIVQVDSSKDTESNPKDDEVK